MSFNSFSYKCIVLATSVFIVLLATTFSSNTFANKVDILVLSNKHQSVPNVGVSLTLLGKNHDKDKAPVPQVMNQIDTQFSPHILMAQKGANISFPNSDNVKHHVYSFSEAKTFELKLYKDQKPEPLPFEQAGTVTLGCNIHDWMLGYVYVVDTPYFSKTNESGFLQLELPDGDYEVRLYNPLLQKSDLQRVDKVSISGNKNITIQLKHAMLSATDSFEEGDEFDAY